MSRRRRGAATARIIETWDAYASMEHDVDCRTLAEALLIGIVWLTAGGIHGVCIETDRRGYGKGEEYLWARKGRERLIARLRNECGITL